MTEPVKHLYCRCGLFKIDIRGMTLIPRNVTCPYCHNWLTRAWYRITHPNHRPWR